MDSKKVGELLNAHVNTAWKAAEDYHSAEEYLEAKDDIEMNIINFETSYRLFIHFRKTVETIEDNTRIFLELSKAYPEVEVSKKIHDKLDRLKLFLEINLAAIRIVKDMFVRKYKETFAESRNYMQFLESKYGKIFQEADA